MQTLKDENEQLRRINLRLVGKVTKLQVASMQVMQDLNLTREQRSNLRSAAYQLEDEKG